MKNFLKRLLSKRSVPTLQLLRDDERAKAIEHQQVAALVCHDLDILLDISDRATDLDALKRQVRYCHKLKETTIRDAKARERRFVSACLIFEAAASGRIRCDRVS